MTIGEALIEQGERRGVQKGLQQGREAGLQQGARGLLLRQLRKRFGAQVTADVEQRLEAASIEQIVGWADRLLDAASLDELLAD